MPALPHAHRRTGVSDTGAGGSRIGRYVTVVVDGSPEVISCVVAREDARKLVLEQVSRQPCELVPGDKLTCTSLTGTWTTTVLSCRGEVIELAAPSWFERSARRRWRRVPATDAVALRITRPADGTVLSARLQDVSVGGASVLLERAPELVPGVTVEVELPTGRAVAEVRSVRSHSHRLLVVAGLAWTRLDPEARSFVAAAAAAGTGLRARTARDE